MDAFEMLDRLEDMALADATKRLRKLSAAELLTLWRHYYKVREIPDSKADTVRELAIELIADGR